MKIPAIRTLVENQKVENLKMAEDAIVNGNAPQIEIDGADEGEKLTHVMAAIWIMDTMAASGADFMTVLRQYSARVRESIDS